MEQQTEQEFDNMEIIEGVINRLYFLEMATAELLSKDDALGDSVIMGMRLFYGDCEEQLKKIK